MWSFLSENCCGGLYITLYTLPEFGWGGCSQTQPNRHHPYSLPKLIALKFSIFLFYSSIIPVLDY